MKPTFLSLYSGCGGFDLGFMQAGFKSFGAYDIDPKVLAVHNKNLHSSVFEYDLSNGFIPFEGKVDVLLAGSPCQGFSTIGKRKLDDPRNHLLLSAGQIAVTVKPTVFVVENVPGVIAGKHRKYWDALHQLLRENGYQTAEYVCDGTKVGLAQMRKRIITIAWKNKKDIEINLPIKKAVSLRDVLKGVAGLDNHNAYSIDKNSKDYLIANKIKQDQKLSNVRSGSRSVHTWDIPEVFGRTNATERKVLEGIIKLRRQIRVRDFGDADPVPSNVLHKKYGKNIIETLVNKGYLKKIDDAYDLVHTFNGKYRRLSWRKPSYTVDTKFGNPRYYLHPNGHRGFSVREAARIQGFPDDFTFSGSEAEQYKMVGNAVPPPMGCHLAKFVSKAILG